MLPPGQQGWLPELASHDQSGPSSQFIDKITEKEFKLGIPRDGDVEAGLGLGRVPRELGPGEVPVELDPLATTAGQVNRFGAGRSSSEEREG